MPPARPEYQKTLAKLASLLKRKPMTARAIAVELGCCVPAAYERLRALKKTGVALYEIEAQQETTGPKATAYGIR